MVRLTPLQSLFLQKRLRRDPLNGFAEIIGRHGDVIAFRRGGRIVYLLNHPDLILHVLRDRASNFIKTRKRRPVFGDGLVTSEGERWAAQRRIGQGTFRPTLLTESLPLVIQATEQMLETWDQKARAGEPVLVRVEMSRLVLRILGQALFGLELGEWSGLFDHSLDVLLRPRPSRMKRLEMLLLPSTRDHYGRALRSLEEMVRHVLAHSADDSPLMSALRRGPEDNPMLGEIPLRDQVSTYLLAASDTTATLLTWTLFCLACRPDLQEQSSGPHLTATLKESLRLYPPIWLMAREAVKEDHIAGERIPAGAEIALLPYLLHRDRRYWQDPETFSPDRFLSSTPPPHPGSYLPFGLGPRACLGKAFAMGESVVILERVLARFRLSPAERSAQVEPLFTLRPRGGVPLFLTRNSRLS